MVDIEELEIWGVSPIHARRLNAKEIMTPKTGENFTFRVADGTESNCLEEIRFSTKNWINPKEAKSAKMIFDEESGGSHRQTQRMTVKPVRNLVDRRELH